MSQVKVSTGFPAGTFGSRLEDFETSYLEYLSEAHLRVQLCQRACVTWQHAYDGDDPTPDSSLGGGLTRAGGGTSRGNVSTSTGGEISPDVSGGDVSNLEPDPATDDTQLHTQDSTRHSLPPLMNNHDNSEFTIVDSAIVKMCRYDSKEDNTSQVYNPATKRGRYTTEEEFISMLEESASPQEKSANVEESLKCLESLLSSYTQPMSISCTSTPRKDLSVDSMVLGAEGDVSTVYYDCDSHLDDTGAFTSANETSFDIIENMTSKTKNTTEFEVVSSQSEQSNSEQSVSQSSKCPDRTSFVDISASGSPAPGEASLCTERMNSDQEAMEVIVNHFSMEGQAAPPPLASILVSRPHGTAEETRADKSVRFSETTFAQHGSEAASTSSLQAGHKSAGKSLTTPNIGWTLVSVEYI